ncbi:MAG: hypothetical protein VX568_03095, partial [Actinomycetota bacterium]|nr:hypothetical protein [Actinomycetota bacterium]
MSRLQRTEGVLYHSFIDLDGTWQTNPVTGFISLVGTDETKDTDITLFQSEPAICFRDSAAQNFNVARRQANGTWVIERVSDSANAGSECAIDVVEGQLVTAYSEGGRLLYGQRNAGGTWASTVVDFT